MEGEAGEAEICGGGSFDPPVTHSVSMRFIVGVTVAFGRLEMAIGRAWCLSIEGEAGEAGMCGGDGSDAAVTHTVSARRGFA